METFNHAFTVAFSVPGSRYEYFADCAIHETEMVIAALEQRLAELKKMHDEMTAVGLWDDIFTGFDTFQETAK